MCGVAVGLLKVHCDDILGATTFRCRRHVGCSKGKKFCILDPIKGGSTTKGQCEATAFACAPGYKWVGSRSHGNTPESKSVAVKRYFVVQLVSPAI